MNEWEEKLLNKIRKVIKHGWGDINISISAEGLRKNVFWGFRDLDEEKPLQKYKKGV